MQAQTVERVAGRRLSQTQARPGTGNALFAHDRDEDLEQIQIDARKVDLIDIHMDRCIHQMDLELHQRRADHRPAL